MPRGSKPGERRGGRQAGTRNKKTQAIQQAKNGGVPKPTWNGKFTSNELARAYTPLAIEVLAKVAAHSQSDSARISAATTLLDRGWGKPATQESPPLPKETPYEMGMTVDPLIKPNGNGHAAFSLADFRKIG
jgi:hypothetical protein